MTHHFFNLMVVGATLITFDS